MRINHDDSESEAAGRPPEDALARLRARWPGRLARGIADAGLAGLTLLLGAALLAFAFPLLDGLNHFMPAWTLAAFGVLVLAWLGGGRQRVRRAAALLSVATLLLVAPVLRLPASSQASASAPSVKVMTFNVHWSGRSAAQFTALVRAAEPDVILLQEVGRRTADTLNAALREHYPHRRFCNDWTGCDSALLSRWPIVESRHILRGEGSPPAIDAVVEILGRRVRIVGVHLMNPEGPRRQQREMEWLSRHLASARGTPLIVAGDFNLTPWTFTLARFTAATGLVRHTGLSGSWPATSRSLPPLFPIDHVMTSQHFSAARVTTGPRLGSDHLPVIATLSLR